MSLPERSGMRQPFKAPTSESAWDNCVSSTSCVPKLIVFPVVSNQQNSTIGAIDDAPGFLKLLPQSSGIIVERDSTRAQMTLLGKLANQVQFCELRAGRDVFETPMKVSELLKDFAGSVR